MKMVLQHSRAEEYLTVFGLLALITLCGFLALTAAGDLIIIGLTAGLIVAALIFLNHVEPIHLLYALCLGIPFLPYINLQMFPLSGIYVIALLFVVLSFLSMVRSERRIIISPQAKWLAAFLAIGIFSIIVAPDKKAVVVYGGQFFLYICIYVATVNILDAKSKVIRALKYIIYGSLFTVFMSVIQLMLSLFSIGRVVDVFFETFIGELFIGSKGIERLGDSAALILNRGSNVAESSNLVLFRVFGPFEGPTIFGWYLLVIGLLVGGLYMVQFKKRRIGIHKYSNAALFLLITLCLVFTWTRSALLAFIIAFIFILIYRHKESVQVFTPKTVRFLIWLITVPLLVFGLLWLFQVPLPTEAITQFSFQSLGGSAVARLLTILFALNYIVNHPLIGIGMGNYKYAQPGADTDTSGASFASAHNTYLELGVELGLPGLIIFLMILYSFLKQAAVLVQASVGSFYHTLGIVFISIWIGFALVSFFGGNLVHPRFMTLLWILAGIQTASYYLYLNDKKKEDTVYRLETAH